MNKALAASVVALATLAGCASLPSAPPTVSVLVDLDPASVDRTVVVENITADRNGVLYTGDRMSGNVLRIDPRNPRPVVVGRLEPAEREGDFDADSRFAIAWFEQHANASDEFGAADVLARAKNTNVQGLCDASMLESKRGKLRLLKAAELPEDWDLATDARFTQ